jgi:hypothetical protein
MMAIIFKFFGNTQLQNPLKAAGESGGRQHPAAY